jgi:hypothetical protein
MELKSTRKTKRYGDWISPSIIKYKRNSQPMEIEGVIFTVKPVKSAYLKNIKLNKLIDNQT